MRYTWDKVIGSSVFATKDKTIKEENDLKTILIWWNKNHTMFPKGIYQLVEWNGKVGTVIMQFDLHNNCIEIN